MNYKVKKRNKELVDYDINKITDVIKKAFVALKKRTNDQVIQLLALNVTSDFENKIIDNTISVEDIQDSVEKILFKSGYGDVAKAYILYRKDREKLRSMQMTIEEFKKSIEISIKQRNIKGHCLGSLILHNSNAVTKNFWLKTIYDEDINNSFKEGMIYLNDLGYLCPLNISISVKEIVEKGLNGFEVNFRKAKHFDSIVNHLSHFLKGISNEYSKDIELLNFDTYLAPFVKEDKLKYDDVKQVLESFIYNLNINHRLGAYKIKSIIKFDIVVPKKLEDINCKIADKSCSFKYSDVKKEMDMIHKAVLEILNQGDEKNISFEYPLLKYSFDETTNILNNEFKNLIFSLIAKKHPIFFSFKDVELDCYGSLSASVMNLALYACNSKDVKDFYQKLDYYFLITARGLDIKQRVVKKLFNENFFPVTKGYIENYDNFLLEIRITGIEELLLNAKWLQGLGDRASYEFIFVVLQHCHNLIEKYNQNKNVNIVLNIEKDRRILRKLANYHLDLYKNLKLYKENEYLYFDNDDPFKSLEFIKNIQKFFGKELYYNYNVFTDDVDVKTLESFLKKVNTNFKQGMSFNYDNIKR